jgi:hypothetical protein
MSKKLNHNELRLETSYGEDYSYIVSLGNVESDIPYKLNGRNVGLSVKRGKTYFKFGEEDGSYPVIGDGIRLILNFMDGSCCEFDINSIKEADQGHVFNFFLKEGPLNTELINIVLEENGIRSKPLKLRINVYDCTQTFHKVSHRLHKIPFWAKIKYFTQKLFNKKINY